MEVREPKSVKPKRVIRELRKPVSCAVSPDGKYAIVTFENQMAKLWDTSTGAQLMHFSVAEPTSGEEDSVPAMCQCDISSSGSIVSVTNGKAAFVFEAKNGLQRYKIDRVQKGLPLSRGCKLTSDGEILVAGFNSLPHKCSSQIVIADWLENRILRTLNFGKASLDTLKGSASFAMSIDGTRMVGSFYNGNKASRTRSFVEAFDVVAGKSAERAIWEMANPTEGTGVSMGANGDRVCFRNTNRLEITHTSMRDEPCDYAIENHEGPHRFWSGYNTMSADGARGLVALIGGKYALLDLNTGAELALLEGHTDYLRGCALSQDGGIAVTCAEDNKVQVWDLEELRSGEDPFDEITLVQHFHARVEAGAKTMSHEEAVQNIRELFENKTLPKIYSGQEIEVAVGVSDADKSGRIDMKAYCVAVKSLVTVAGGPSRSVREAIKVFYENLASSTSFPLLASHAKLEILAKSPFESKVKESNLFEGVTGSDVDVQYANAGIGKAPTDTMDFSTFLRIATELHKVSQAARKSAREASASAETPIIDPGL